MSDLILQDASNVMFQVNDGSGSSGGYYFRLRKWQSPYTTTIFQVDEDGTVTTYGDMIWPGPPATNANNVSATEMLHLRSGGSDRLQVVVAAMGSYDVQVKTTGTDQLVFEVTGDQLNIFLDTDSDETASFRVQNGLGSDLFTVREDVKMTWYDSGASAQVQAAWASPTTTLTVGQNAGKRGMIQAYRRLESGTRYAGVVELYPGGAVAASFLWVDTTLKLRIGTDPTAAGTIVGTQS
ncbi:MAG: hypothetical protein EXR69_10175 [Myxococcales bacterium]|nr:hypothetical protein [Myxococcales bacterium]